GDPHSTLDSGCGFEGLETVGHITDSHHSDHYPLFPFDGVDFVPKLANPFANVVDFRFRRVGPHRDDHLIFLWSPKWKTHSFEWVGLAKLLKSLAQRHSTDSG